MKYYYLLIALFVITNNAISQTSGYIKMTTECLGSELDGSVTLKSWGSGRNNKDAVEQAMKNAVNEVIFNGIKDGEGSCPRSPIIVDQNIQKKNEEYFAVFFADGGAYKEFVSLKDEKISHKFKRDKKKRDVSITESAVVRVNRLMIKKKLVNDKIISNYRE
jgi:hypothetical protein